MTPALPTITRTQDRELTAGRTHARTLEAAGMYKIILMITRDVRAEAAGRIKDYGTGALLVTWFMTGSAAETTEHPMQHTTATTMMDGIMLVHRIPAAVMMELKGAPTARISSIETTFVHPALALTA